MKKKCEKGLICASCYHRLDCDDLPNQKDWCVLYKMGREIELHEDQSADMIDTVEFNNDDLKLLYEKMR